MTDEEIEKGARSMIAEFGANAKREASDRASSARAKGLVLIALAWQNIFERIKELQADG